jgi:2-phosphosulfolactate phosphatase
VATPMAEQEAPSEDHRTVRVCLSPSLLPHLKLSEAVVVVIDVLRFTTTLAVAFDNGVLEVVPTETIEECAALGQQGYLTAAERNGQTVPGFHFGNSPYAFMDGSLAGKKLAVTTTNGTQAIHAARAAYQIVTGSFANQAVLTTWLAEQGRPVVLLCSGWKHNPNLEDTIFAGAMVVSLQQHGFRAKDDSSMIARALYVAAARDKRFYIEHSSHYQRLIELKLQRDVKYCLRANTHAVLPLYQGGRLLDILRPLSATAH